MAKCPNCSKTLSCGCQNRTASDGKAVCSNCLNNYESTLKSPDNNTNSIAKPRGSGRVNKYNNLQKFI